MNLIMVYSLGGGTLSTPWGKELPISCLVRNEVNPPPFRRGLDEVVYTEPGDGSQPKPYMPRQFPLGSWNVTRLIYVEDDGSPLTPYEAPVLIMTDAWRTTPQWAVKQLDKLMYVVETSQLVRDSGFALHTSTSITTLGCGRVGPILVLGESDSIREEKLAEGVDMIRWVEAQIAASVADSDVIELQVQA